MIEEESNYKKDRRLDWKDQKSMIVQEENKNVNGEYTDLESENIIGGNKRVDIG